jgi:hypothetical protein
MNALIRCVDCNVVYEISPFDQCPEYHYSETAGEYLPRERHDELDFSRIHRGHRTEELTILEKPLYSEGPYFDPQRIVYFEATNGNKTFLIKRWRQSVLEPVRYDIVPGRLEVQKTIEIQKRSLEKQIRHELNNPSLAEEKVYKFIEIVQDAALQCDPDKNFPGVCESSDAQIDYLPLDEEQISGILNKSRAIFTGDELHKIERFIRNNCEYNGVMSLVLKKIPVFHPAAQSEPLSN